MLVGVNDWNFFKIFHCPSPGALFQSPDDIQLVLLLFLYLQIVKNPYFASACNKEIIVSWYLSFQLRLMIK